VRSWLVAVSLAATMAVGGMSRADGELPGSMEQTFAKFARGWLGKLAQEPVRAAKGVRFLGPKGPDSPNQFTYRDAGEDFAIQMKPTGNAASPFVGILSYTENVYVCRGPTRDDCELVESSPITEIFPFRDGRWQY